MASDPSPYGIRKNADLLMSLGKLGTDWDAAQKQAKMNSGQLRTQAIQQQGDLSNNLFNQEQTNAQNRFNTINGMTNFTELLDQQNRRDAMLRQMVAKNPRLAGFGAFGTPEQRKKNAADSVWKESTAAAEYLTPGQWNERYDTGVLQNLLTGDGLGSQRDSIMRAGQDTLKNQQAQLANWQGNQTSTAQAIQQQLDTMARQQDKTGLASKLGLLLAVLGGVGKSVAGAAAGGGAGA